MIITFQPAVIQRLCTHSLKDFKASNILAVQVSSISHLTEMLTRSNPDRNRGLSRSDINGDSPLHFVARTGNIPLYDLMVAAGCDPALENIQGISPSAIMSSIKQSGKSLLLNVIGAYTPHIIFFS